MFCQDYLAKIIELEANGNDTNTDRIIFIILHQWILILQRYHDSNWDSSGNVIDPPLEDCHTVQDIEGLLLKVNDAIGCKNYQINDFVVAFGIWNDNGHWVDQSSLGGIWRDL